MFDHLATQQELRGEGTIENHDDQGKLGGRHQTKPQNMDLTWEEAEELANDKAEWRRRVAQCNHLDAG